MKKIFTKILIFLSIFWISKSTFAHEISEKQINKIIKKFLIDNPALIENSLKNSMEVRSFSSPIPSQKLLEAGKGFGMKIQISLPPPSTPTFIN